MDVYVEEGGVLVWMRGRGVLVEFVGERREEGGEVPFQMAFQPGGMEGGGGWGGGAKSAMGRWR